VAPAVAVVVLDPLLHEQTSAEASATAAREGDGRRMNCSPFGNP